MGDQRLEGIFRPEGEIPQACRLEEACRQREYLVDGELRRWEGPVQEVFSPVLIERGGRLLRKAVGSYPLLGEAEALQALEAAAGAYDHGSGLWPTMRVEERIDAVGRFLRGMVERRAQVVRLLLWEIGKSLEDSEKEFDRTVAYVSATLEALNAFERGVGLTRVCQKALQSAEQRVRILTETRPDAEPEPFGTAGGGAAPGDAP